MACPTCTHGNPHRRPSSLAEGERGPTEVNLSGRPLPPTDNHLPLLSTGTNPRPFKRSTQLLFRTVVRSRAPTPYVYRPATGAGAEWCGGHAAQTCVTFHVPRPDASANFTTRRAPSPDQRAEGDGRPTITLAGRPADITYGTAVQRDRQLDTSTPVVPGKPLSDSPCRQVGGVA